MSVSLVAVEENKGLAVVPAAPEKRCENCDAPVSANFCAECGQSTKPMHTSLGHLFHDLLEYFHIEGKLVATYKKLAFSPGTLTTEYWAGKRASSIGPFRIYLFTTLVYFFVTSLDIYGAAIRSQDLRTPEQRAALREKIEKASSEDAVGHLTKEFMLRSVRVEETGGYEKMGHELPKAMSRAMFVLLPFFAALLSLAFRRDGRGFPHHFVHSLHLHSFAFLLWTAQSFIPYPWITHTYGTRFVGIISFALLGLSMAAIAFYGAKSLKRTYGFSWPSTLGRGLAVGAVYGLSIVVASTSFFLWWIWKAGAPVS